MIYFMLVHWSTTVNNPIRCTIDLLYSSQFIITWFELKIVICYILQKFFEKNVCVYIFLFIYVYICAHLYISHIYMCVHIYHLYTCFLKFLEETTHTCACVCMYLDTVHDPLSTFSSCFPSLVPTSGILMLYIPHSVGLSVIVMFHQNL